MSKISEMFEQTFKTILINLTEEEISLLFLGIRSGNWQGTYKSLIKKMTGEEICELQDTINGEFKEANARNASLIETQEQIIIEALSSWVLGYKAVL